MLNWFLQTGVYLISLSLIFIAGLTLAYWGLWGNRSKGRPRCPKCWYDMRGSLPSVVCPECGHDGRVERRLYKNRRRWWAIVVGIILMLPSGYSLNLMYGWYREQAAIATIKANTKARTVGMGVYAAPKLILQFTPNPIGPKWLFKHLPTTFTRFWDRTDWFHVSDSDLTDDSLPMLVHQLARLQYLQNLNLSNNRLNDGSLSHLKELTLQLHKYQFVTA